MGRPASKRKCQVCGRLGLIRNGTTSAGKTRWRCTKCGASATRSRSDQADLAAFAEFLTWAQGPQTQGQVDDTATGRSFRRRIAWCWSVPVPPPAVTGEIHDQVFIDGTYFGRGWCLLIARARCGPVIAWQWCNTENSAAYKALFTAIPAPRVVTTDGHGGALKAIRETWPDTKVQRCLLHVHRNNTRDLTRNPKTMAGKALLGLSKALLDVEDKVQATHWAALLARVHTEYRDYFNERTYARDDPIEAHKRGKKPTSWWYTHGRDRRVYQRLSRLYKRGELFAFLTTISDVILERTTNPVESINRQVKEVPKRHPGLTADHLTGSVEWVLHTYTENPATAPEILKAWDTHNRPTRRLIPKKRQQTQPIGPKEYDTTLTTEEGLRARKGWAGRPYP